MLRVNPTEFFASLGLDLVVVILLAFLLFYRRHRDREMAISIAAINITLWALTGALASYTLSLGVGFALFAVISVIRLRSATASWVSMAYLLVGLGSGLVIGLTGFDLLEKAAYSGFLVAVMAIVDARFMMPKREQLSTKLALPGSNIDPDYLREKVVELLNVEPLDITVKGVAGDPLETKLEIKYRKRNG